MRKLGVVRYGSFIGESFVSVGDSVFFCIPVMILTSCWLEISPCRIYPLICGGCPLVLL